MENRILFIDSWNNVGNFFRSERNKIKNLENVNLYKNDSLFNKFFRWLGLKFYKPLLYFSYGDWKYHVTEYNIFILESRKTFEYAIEYIRKKTNKRVIVWYWNEVTERELKPNVVKSKYNCEVWSFDKENAQKYNMNFNDTYYFSTVRLPENKIINDIFYIGIDREGRIERLQELSKYLKEYDCTYNFNLTISPIKTPNKNYNYKPKLDYQDVLSEISKSRVILDLTKESQYGLTLRPVEALFFHKKLITDNKNIINYKFYNKENIFVIGIDNYDDLKEFIKSDYIEIKQDIIDSYDFKNWLKRIVYKGDEIRNV